MTTILEISSLAGRLKKVSGASGGEWAGPCPWCSGEDRFRCWPDHPSGATGGRFLCRGCGRQGDGIAFLREFEGLSYAEACKRLGTEPTGRARQGGFVRACPAVWEPKSTVSPDDAWTMAAGKFVEYAVAQMAANEDGQAYAASRGLTPATVAALRIGWNPSDLFHDRAAWGLEEEVNERTGKPRKVWQPKGLVIPTIRAGQVIAIKIRRADWTPEDRLPKYACISGSSKAPMILAPGKDKPCVIVESELDAILVAQEARDLVTAIAMRTAKGKPDSEAHAILLAAPVILIATDADEAGATAFPWWRSTYSKAVRWPVLSGKDVGDMAATPGLIRAWVEAGIHPPVSEPSLLAGKSKSLRRRSDVLAHGVPCTTSDAGLEKLRVSYPHLQVCPATTPPWNFRSVSDCATRCPTPCELQAANPVVAS